MKKLWIPVLVLLFFLAGFPLWAQKTAGDPAGEAVEDLPELDIETIFRGRITETALQCLGVPYKYAGANPEGFDCSGLIYYAYREAAGMELSRSTEGLWTDGKEVVLDNVKPGDVLVFTTVRPGASHAGIVLENTGKGVTFVHAASQGPKLGVIVSNLNERYYKTRIMGARSFF
ncbi:MAG: C40 family peptidase [Treponema sp.]|jgi:cell wall-associated NlpC family hydrolase|nr:C40 family peptidase [Treponema sp.]